MAESGESKTVELSAETFRRLQALAEPFVDTVDSVIAKLLDRAAAVPPNPHVRAVAGAYQFNPFAPPPLTHTRVEAARVGTDELASPTWNNLPLEVLRRAAVPKRELYLLRGIGDFNCVEGEKIDAGYKFIPDLGISVQGQDANGACRTAFNLARHFQVQLIVHFAWRDKPEAAHPGVSAFLSFDPNDG